MGGPGCYAPKAGGGAPTTSHELVVNDLGRGLRLTSSGDRGTPSQLAWGEDGTQRGDHRDRGRHGGAAERRPDHPALGVRYPAAATAAVPCRPGRTIGPRPPARR